MKKYFIFSAALLLSACVTTGPEPVVTQAERDAAYKQLDFREQCVAVVKRQPIQSVDPAADCECVHRKVADLMPAWIVRKNTNFEAGTDRTPYTVAEQRRMETEIPQITLAAYRSCGVVN